MKLSVSLPDDDVAALDEFVRKTGLGSRSAGVLQAVRMLRLAGLEEDYAAAWTEWDESGEREMWEQTVGDGVA